MTEKEFILSSDLQTVRMLRKMLADIVPANNQFIDDQEHTTISRAFFYWQERIENAINIKVDE